MFLSVIIGKHRKQAMLVVIIGLHRSVPVFPIASLNGSLFFFRLVASNNAPEKKNLLS